MKRTFLTAMLLLLVAAGAYADAADAGKRLSVRTFQFKHKQADRAAALIKDYMSGEGTMSIQPASNSLVVTDAPENLKKIAAVLAEFDAPARPYRLAIRIVSASRATAARIDEGLQDVAPKLALLRYNSLEKVGAADVSGSEGEAGQIDFTGYRADFKFGEYDPASDSMKLSDFRLWKVDGTQMDPLLKTTLNLKLGQTVVIGATRQPQSAKALMIVVSATR